MSAPVPIITITNRRGHSTETADPLLVFQIEPYWDASHRGDGVCSATLISRPSPLGVFQKRYPHGLPNLSGALDGPALWDIRDAAQSPVDPSTGLAWPAYDPAATYAAGATVMFGNSQLPGNWRTPYLSLTSGNVGNTPDLSPTDWVSTWTNYPVYDAGTTYAQGDRVLYRGAPYVSAASGNTGNTPKLSPVTPAGRVTISVSSPAIVTRTAHGLSAGDIVTFTDPTGNLPTGLVAGVAYYVLAAGLTVNVFQVAATRGGSAINTTGAGGGAIAMAVQGNGAWIAVAANPVLQVIDYLVDPDHGMGLDRATLIDPVLAVLAVEAGHCGELVLRASGLSEPRYASNGFLTYSTDPASVVGSLLSTCDGWLTPTVDGTLGLVVGVYRPPTVMLTDRHIVGMTVSYGVADESVVNELAITFTDPAQKFSSAPVTAWRDEADISSRGVTRSQSLDLPWVQSSSQARRLAKRAMARLQAPLRGTGIATLYGMAIQGERWIGLDYSLVDGLQDVVVEVQHCDIDFKSGRVTFDWIVVDPATIDEWGPEEEALEPVNPGDDGADSLFPVPTGLTLVSFGDASTGGASIGIRIDDPLRPDLTYLIRYSVLDESTGAIGPWVTQTALNPSADGTYVTMSTAVVSTINTYQVEVATVASLGTRSDWTDPIAVASVGTWGLLTEDGQALLTETGELLEIEHT